MWRVTGQGLERDRSLIRVVPLPPVPRNRHRPWPRTTQESGSRKRSQGHFHSLLAKWYHFPRGWGLSAGLSSRSCGTAALSLHRVRGWKIDTRRGSEQSATKVIVDNGIAPNDTHHDDGERERGNPKCLWNAIFRPELTTNDVIFFSLFLQIQPAGIMPWPICMEMGYVPFRESWIEGTKDVGRRNDKNRAEVEEERVR